MLLKIVMYNAKKQAKEYAIYWFTLIITVALIYGFNSIFFYNKTRELFSILDKGSGSLDYRYILVIFSVIVIVALAWFVTYMTDFMLKRRSEEIGIYLILGLDKSQIIKMLIFEFIAIGISAVILGLIVGVGMSTILYTLLLKLFQYKCESIFEGAFFPTIITIFYFSIIYPFAWIMIKKKIVKMQLIDLIDYEKKREYVSVSFNLNILYLLIGLLCCGIGEILLLNFELSFARICFVTILFFIGIMMIFRGGIGIFQLSIEKSRYLKYKNNRILEWRILVNKIKTNSLSMGLISIIFMICLVCIGMSIGLINVMMKSHEMHPFDISIVYPGSSYDYSKYESYISSVYGVNDSHSYNIYTTKKSDFAYIRDKALLMYWNKLEKNLELKDVIYSENRYDTYMKYSDYCYLRKMMGLKTEMIAEDELIIHCMPFLEEHFNEKLYEVDGSVLKCKTIYTDFFDQLEGYGNGQGYIIVVPDEKVKDMKIEYSLFVANTNELLDDKSISELEKKFVNTRRLSEHIVADDGSGYSTKLCFGKKNYVTTKYELKSANQAILLVIPLLYLSIIAGVIGLVIISVRLLSDKKYILEILRLSLFLGLSEKKIRQILKKIIVFHYFIPIVPALILGTQIIKKWGAELLITSFNMPVFDSYNLILCKMTIVAVLFFFSVSITYTFLTYYIARNSKI